MTFETVGIGERTNDVSFATGIKRRRSKRYNVCSDLERAVKIDIFSLIKQNCRAAAPKRNPAQAVALWKREAAE